MEVLTSSDTAPDVTELKLTIEGMRAKLNEYKRFKAQYQANLRAIDVQDEVLTRTRRENRRLRRALCEVALSRPGTTTVKYLSKYADKVLEGLGFSPNDIAREQWR
jgi:Ran GTPase-activating protein (RanGAP) involved in mRNA processing and transport